MPLSAKARSRGRRSNSRWRHSSADRIERSQPSTAGSTATETAISESGQARFDLFNGKANCAACHSGWAFTDASFHDIGSARDDDWGRGRLFPTSVKLRYAFKTPTLRDVARRGPTCTTARCRRWTPSSTFMIAAASSGRAAPRKSNRSADPGREGRPHRLPADAQWHARAGVASGAAALKSYKQTDPVRE